MSAVPTISTPINTAPANASATVSPIVSVGSSMVSNVSSATSAIQASKTVATKVTKATTAATSTASSDGSHNAGVAVGAILAGAFALF
ncbi:hypothetical protein NEOLI_000988 [Neolecta irregularis DAH-3]|uniref:Uncharacterized protein n=1 Tax=Neolecta irregularis (strain DAH-3) TaxID=1198029 RepID=A0A1U7LGV3_NEOID|nr:hypothetical protein NEOLI_000988 [Neolecta irregularis DAH-3]|eukprot:OLL21886.1 hypothetical protein NEOLI_000988 [Neolecta irregularis DAH-3]